MTCDAAHPGATCWVIKPLLRIDYAFLSPTLAPPEDAAAEPILGAAGDAAAAADKLATVAAAAAVAVTARVRGYQRVEDDASDHFPVVVDLSLHFGAPRDTADVN